MRRRSSTRPIERSIRPKVVGATGLSWHLRRPRARRARRRSPLSALRAAALRVEEVSSEHRDAHLARAGLVAGYEYSGPASSHWHRSNAELVALAAHQP